MNLWRPFSIAGLCLCLSHTAQAETLTLYSRLTAAPAVVRAFTKKTGIEIRLRRPPATGMRARIIREGNRPRWALAWFYGVATAISLDHRGLLAHHLPVSRNLTPRAATLTSPNGAYVPTGITIAAVLLAETSAPFAPPKTWSDLANPAYHGLIGISDPATSEQNFATLTGIMNAAGGWPAGKAAFETLKTDGLHIYADTRTTITALRSGAIQLAIVRGSVAGRYPALQTIIPQPATLLPSVIVMAKSLTGRRRADATKFITFVNSAAGQKITDTGTGIWPVATEPSSLTTLAPIALGSNLSGRRRGRIMRWFSNKIVGPTT